MSVLILFRSCRTCSNCISRFRRNSLYGILRFVAMICKTSCRALISREMTLYSPRYESTVCASRSSSLFFVSLYGSPYSRKQLTLINCDIWGKEYLEFSKKFIKKRNMTSCQNKLPWEDTRDVQVDRLCMLRTNTLHERGMQQNCHSCVIKCVFTLHHPFPLFCLELVQNFRLFMGIAIRAVQNRCSVMTPVTFSRN